MTTATLTRGLDRDQWLDRPTMATLMGKGEDTVRRVQREEKLTTRIGPNNCVLLRLGDFIELGRIPASVLDPEISAREVADAIASGGTITNGTTAAIRLSNAPAVVVAGVSGVRALGSVEGPAVLEPGQVLPWAASDFGVFAIDYVTGYDLDLTYTSVFWQDGLGWRCAEPVVEVQ